MPISNKEISEILDKYKKKLDKNLTAKDMQEYRPSSNFSREYSKFRDEALGKNLSLYEKLCKFSDSVVKISPSKKDFDKIQEAISVAHLNITPNMAASFSLLVVTFLSLIGLVVGLVSYFLFGNLGVLAIGLLLILVSVLILNPLTRLPVSISNRWRMSASNQMVLCILYIVIYMRHTSNLENAIKFSADHIDNPLSLDLRKVFWDVETGKYSTVKESLDNYLVRWRKTNLEFVNSFQLIQSSLYEPSENRRIELLDKSLNVILDGTYENMLHYAHNLKNPITMLHMLGVILPILGLVIFPLIGAFMSGSIKWYHLFILYNILLPLIVYNVGINILNKRPGSYGEINIPLMPKKGVAIMSIIVVLIFTIIGFSPFIIHAADSTFDFSFWQAEDGTGGEKFLDFYCNEGKCVGPFGLGALLISLLIPLGLALGIGWYYVSKTSLAMKIRNETKRLEKEFSTALFQLGTRIGDGIPAELAFKDVAKTMSGTPSGKFFEKVHMNLTKNGLSLRDAIFDPDLGAILEFPSPLVQSSMEVLIESSRKGPLVVSQSLTSISIYVNNVHSVNERLKDLLSEIISSMQSQISFMAPVISGIVVGIASMVVGVISKLTVMLEQVGSDQTLATGTNLASLANLFDKSSTVPGYFFQVVVGIYVVQIIYILSILASAIEYGPDKLNEKYSAGKNVLKGTLIYLIVSLIVILLFNKIASSVLATSMGAV
ncbi:hypothetical protein J4438_01545 [Candidatus Woesearchaeota archaeon]|nr:hypothetical protein [Candidatus Woesearchaeota archaeon]